MTMSIRKIAVVGSFAAGAALAFAPLAAADTDITDFVNGEIASLNSIFGSQAALAGVPSTDIDPGTGDITTAHPFDTIAASDVNPAFASLLYGVDPAANAVDDPGSYIVYNGALTQFDDAYNVGLYALLNGGDLISGDAVADSLFGSSTTIGDALDTDSVFGAMGVFLSAGFADLLGYLF